MSDQVTSLVKNMIKLKGLEPELVIGLSETKPFRLLISPPPFFFLKLQHTYGPLKVATYILCKRINMIKLRFYLSPIPFCCTRILLKGSQLDAFSP